MLHLTFFVCLCVCVCVFFFFLFVSIMLNYKVEWSFDMQKFHEKKKKVSLLNPLRLTRVDTFFSDAWKDFSQGMANLSSTR